MKTMLPLGVLPSSSQGALQSSGLLLHSVFKAICEWLCLRPNPSRVHFVPKARASGGRASTPKTPKPRTQECHIQEH